MILGQEIDPNSVSAGPLGLLVVLLMIIATVFLIRNMNARLRNLPREFPPPDDSRDDDETDETSR